VVGTDITGATAASASGALHAIWSTAVHLTTVRNEGFQYSSGPCCVRFFSGPPGDHDAGVLYVG